MKEDQKELTREEAIRRIEQAYGAKADPDNLIFDVFDQLYVCEQLAKEEENQQKRKGYFMLTQDKTHETNGNVSVNGMSNGTYKRNVNEELTKRKREVIENLKTCNANTPPRKIAKLLGELFINQKTKEGHWLYIAQKWNPRAINRVINQMSRHHRLGTQTIKEPAAYFTHAIKFRKKRRSINSYE